jgi:peptidoglycan/LPS O-acetylase OafA/YrhL
VALVAPSTATYVNIALLLLAPIVVTGCTAANSWTAKLLSTRPLLWLGRLSYALFLSHGVAQKFLHYFLSEQRFASASLTVRLSISLIYALVVSVTPSAY